MKIPWAHLHLKLCLSYLPLRTRRVSLRWCAAVIVFLLPNVICASAIRACEPTQIGNTGNVASFLTRNGVFFPVGVNYFHLSHTPYPSFDTFDQKEFEESKIDAAFATIHNNGFNYVRLYLAGYEPDRGFEGIPNRIGRAYLQNIAQTLSLAEKHHLYVVLTGRFKDRGIPSNYLPQRGAVSGISGANRLLLAPSYSAGIAAFYHDLLRGLEDINGNILSCVLYFDLYSELQFDGNSAPLSSEHGTFRFGQKDYRLDDQVDRQALINTASDRWLRQVITEVKATAPNLHVTASIFPNAIFGRRGFDGAWPNPRSREYTVDPYPIDPRVLAETGADLLDIHLYVHPPHGLTPSMHDDLYRVMGSSGVFPSSRRKIPIVVGELGALKSLYASPDDAIPELTATLTGLCKFGISGWAFWMWDGPGPTWSLTAERGVLIHALSPMAVEEFGAPCSHYGPS
jgi:hypothetical protein